MGLAAAGVVGALSVPRHGWGSGAAAVLATLIAVPTGPIVGFLVGRRSDRKPVIISIDPGLRRGKLHSD